MVSEFLKGYCSALGWNLDRHDHCTLATGVVSCCYQLSPPGLDMGHVDVWVSVTDRQEPQPELVECVEVDGGTQETDAHTFHRIHQGEAGCCSGGTVR